jgi:hypothetical protein
LTFVLAAGAALDRRAEARPFARPYRLALSVSPGVGWASLSSFHGAVDALIQQTLKANPGVSLQGGGKSNVAASLELSFRYYFPYYLLAQVGIQGLYNGATARFQRGSATTELENHNMVLEVPLLAGGYYTLFDRLYVYGVVGPSVFFYGRSWLDPGSDFKADSGVGVHVGGGAEYLFGEHFGLGLELRYRYLVARELKEKNTGTVITSQMLGQPGTSTTYDLDFSGVTAMLNLRIFLL